MKKIAVVYKSKYGSTRKYAAWIAEKLACDLLEAEKTTPSLLENYDTLIFGSGIYAGKINGISLLSKNFPALARKNILVFVVGLTDPADNKQLARTINKTFSKEMRQRLSFFTLRGGLDNTHLLPRLLMWVLKISLKLKAKAKRSPAEEKLLAGCYAGKIDFTSEQAIMPIVEQAKSVTAYSSLNNV